MRINWTRLAKFVHKRSVFICLCFRWKVNSFRFVIKSHFPFNNSILLTSISNQSLNGDRRVQKRIIWPKNSLPTENLMILFYQRLQSMPSHEKVFFFISTKKLCASFRPFQTVADEYIIGRIEPKKIVITNFNCDIFFGFKIHDHELQAVCLASPIFGWWWCWFFLRMPHWLLVALLLYWKDQKSALIQRIHSDFLSFNPMYKHHFGSVAVYLHCVLILTACVYCCVIFSP